MTAPGKDKDLRAAIADAAGNSFFDTRRAAITGVISSSMPEDVERVFATQAAMNEASRAYNQRMREDAERARAR